MGEWATYRLGDLCEIKHGFAFKGEYFTDQETSDLLVTPGNFAIGGGFRDSKPKYYDGPIDEGYVLQTGELVLTMTDLSKDGDTLGYPAIIPATPGVRYLHNQRIGLVRVIDESLLDGFFAFYLLRSRRYRQHVLSTASGSTVRHTSPSRIYDYEAQLPPLPEQRAIASVLGSLDDKIELNRRMNRTLEAMAAAIFKAWFVDFEPVKAKAAGATTFPGMPQPTFDALPTTFTNSQLGPVPEGWEVGCIGNLVDIKGGGTPSTKNPAFWDGPHHWATPKDLSNLSDPILLDTARRLTDAGLDKISSRLLPIGTVLLSSRAPIGYLAITAVPTAVNQGFIAMPPGGPLPPAFLLNWASFYMDDIKGNANGTTFQEISKTNFRPLRTVVSSPEVLAAFDEIVNPLYDQVKLNMHQARSLAALRDALLPKLLSGEVRLVQMNDERTLA
ncbi:MAG: restriction endonuclease subunit S [Phycisphaerales bacterium]